jgi:thymidylate kinase
MLVAFEGLEGVGKSTLGMLVAERLPATYLKSPPEEMDGARAFVAQQADPNCSFYFYLSSLYGMQRSIEVALRDRGIVIADRYIGSTIAYHDQGRSFEPPAFDGSKLWPAAVTVHIRCEADARAARLEGRGFHIFDRNANEDSAIEAYFTRTCELEFWNDAPPKVSADRLVRILRERLGQDV